MNQVTSLDAPSSSAMGDWMVVIKEILLVRMKMSTKIESPRAVLLRGEARFCSSCLTDRTSLSYAVDVRERSGRRSESGTFKSSGAMPRRWVQSLCLA